MVTESIHSTGKTGKFIVFEGIDGAGKTTQIKLLSSRLSDIGRNAVCTSEPTPTTLGKMIRDALSGDFSCSQAELAALFLADRISHNVSGEYCISSLIDKGTDVISDRYYYSSFAYQGLFTDPKWVMDMNLLCPDIRTPDICIFLDIPPELGKSRVDSGRDKLEIFEKDVETLRSVRNRFFTVFDKLSELEKESIKDGNKRKFAKIAVIDASRDPEIIAYDVFKAVTEI